MAGLVILVILVILCLVVAGMFLDNFEVLGLVPLIIGLILFGILVFRVAPKVFDSGEPKTDIATGTYKLAFVYVAGDNVSVGVEFKNGVNKVESLFLHQFKKEAFEGQIMTDAKTLEVVEAGSFKKLLLR